MLIFRFEIAVFFIDSFYSEVNHEKQISVHYRPWSIECHKTFKSNRSFYTNTPLYQMEAKYQNIHQI